MRDKFDKYYDLLKELLKLKTAHFNVVLDKENKKILKITFDRTTKIYVKSKVDLEEFKTFIKLYYMVVMEELKEHINIENVCICDICEVVFNKSEHIEYDVIDSETHQFIEKINICKKCANKIKQNHLKDENFIFKED